MSQVNFIDLKIKMIGTTLIEESSEEILYPSITVCSKISRNEFNGQNLSIFQRSFNMSEVIHTLRFYQKNITGHWNKQVYRPMEGSFCSMERDTDIRDRNCHLLFKHDLHKLSSSKIKYC